MIGNPTSEIAAITGYYATVYDMAQLSASAEGPQLSDDVDFPYFSRLIGSAEDQVDVVFAALEYYENQSPGGPIGWDKVGLICTADESGLAMAQKFIREAPSHGITVASFQQFIISFFDISTEVRQLKSSGARVFVALTTVGWQPLAAEAQKQGILGDDYVWIVGDYVTGLAFYLFVDGVTQIPGAVENTRGALGTLPYIPPTGAN